MTRLEFYRRTRGLSQEQLAALLGPGFTASAVSLIESLRLKPSQRQEQRLHEAFRVPVADLLAPASDRKPLELTP
jgi:transcriptional regulator with XRE-family HTH domain